MPACTAVCAHMYSAEKKKKYLLQLCWRCFVAVTRKMHEDDTYTAHQTDCARTCVLQVVQELWVSGSADHTFMYSRALVTLLWSEQSSSTSKQRSTKREKTSDDMHCQLCSLRVCPHSMLHCYEVKMRCQQGHIATLI